jgi:hypothetical protein
MAYKVPMGLLRQEAQRIFPETVVVTPPTITKNARGGEVKTYNAGSAVTYTNCLLSPARPGQYRQFAGTLKPGSLFTLRFEHAVSIEAESKIVINGSEYQLMNPSPEASYDVSETFMVTLK